MRIASIDTLVTRLPLQREWFDTIHHVTHIELVLVEITSDSGLVGTGISHTSGDGGRTIESLICHSLTPLLLGKDVSPRARWFESWHFLHDLGGAGFTTTALGAVDTALWDLVAKEQRKPLVDVLGRVRDRIPVYASGIDLAHTETELVDEVRRWYELGFRAFKVKVGRPDAAEDRERLTKLREVVGHLPLMVDANQGWGLETAARRIRAFDGLDLTWIEEPLLSDDVRGHATLRRRIDVPIALGENVYNLYQFRDYLVADAVDFVQADIVRVGGITPFMEIATLCRAFNRPMAPHFLTELSAHVLCAVPNAFIAENIEGGSLSALGALRNPVTIVDGYFTPRDVPGHGLDFDREYMAQHRV